MRFFEIAAPPAREAVATKRFEKELVEYCRGYPGLQDVFADFLQFRLTSSQPWGKKDTPLAGGDKTVRGLWHVHLYHGKVIVLYDMQGNLLRLIGVVEHSATDTMRATQQLGKYYQSLSASDFHPFTLATAGPEQQLTSQDVAALSHLFYEMASGSVDDQAILKKAMSGDPTDLFTWTQMTIEHSWSDQDKNAAVLTAFGGQAGLAQAIGKIFKELGIKESIVTEAYMGNAVRHFRKQMRAAAASGEKTDLTHSFNTFVGKRPSQPDDLFSVDPVFKNLKKKNAQVYAGAIKRFYSALLSKLSDMAPISVDD